MPKIRDLGISTLPFARSDDKDGAAPQYWMCNPTVKDPEGGRPPDCYPTPPKCHPSHRPKPKPPCNPTSCNPTKKPGKKYASGLPDDAVVQLRRQLQAQVGRQLHD